jgi:hypothetical protein
VETNSLKSSELRQTEKEGRDELQRNEFLQIINNADNDVILYNNNITGIVTNTSYLHEDIADHLKIKQRSAF